MGLLETDRILPGSACPLPKLAEQPLSTIVKALVQAQAGARLFDRVLMRALGILFIVVAAALGVGAMLRSQQPALYSATAVVKIARDKIDLPELKGIAQVPTGVDTDAGNAFFIETEIAIVKSGATLSPVITQLKLNETWGQRLHRGNALETSESARLLKERLAAQPGAEADSIQIRAFSEVPDEAAEIANAVAHAYCDYRADYRRRLAQTALNAVAQEYSDKETQLLTSRTKVDQAWQQLDPALQEVAATNGSTTPEVMRSIRAQFSEAVLRYLAASNQLARFPNTNTADVEIIDQLKERADKAKAEMTAADTATQSEMRRVALLKNYQAARLQLEELTERFAPLKKIVEELQSDLRPQSQPPASVVEPAMVPTSPDVQSRNRNQWILPTTGVALVLGVGLLFVGRDPQKAAV
jgi:hypothetical protein